MMNCEFKELETEILESTARSVYSSSRSCVQVLQWLIKFPDVRHAVILVLKNIDMLCKNINEILGIIFVIFIESINYICQFVFKLLCLKCYLYECFLTALFLKILSEVFQLFYYVSIFNKRIILSLCLIYY